MFLLFIVFPMSFVLVSYDHAFFYILNIFAISCYNREIFLIFAIGMVNLTEFVPNMSQISLVWMSC